ncbi:MAG: tyrosine-type recombinase/integrase [Planctomycetota bacterium]|jgi:integrase
MRLQGWIFERNGNPYVWLQCQGEILKRRVADEAAGQGKIADAKAFARNGSSLEEIRERLFPSERAKGTQTFRACVEPYLKHAERTLRESTLKHRRAALERIKRAPWARKPLRLIRAADLNRWAQGRYRNGSGRHGRGLSVCAVNRDLAAIGALFSWACMTGLCDTNPAHAENIDRRSERAHMRDVWWTLEEMDYLYGVCAEVAPDFEPFLRLACTTGMRRQELRLMRWRHADLKKQTIHVPKEHSKNGRPRTFRMTQAARDALLGLNPFRADRSACVLLTGAGAAWTDNSVQNRWAKIRKAATGDGLDGEKRGPELRLHDARHSFATHMASAGMPLHLLADVLGQSSTYVTQRYAHVVEDAARRAVDAAGAVFATQTATQAAEADAAGG